MSPVALRAPPEARPDGDAAIAELWQLVQEEKARQAENMVEKPARD